MREPFVAVGHKRAKIRYVYAADVSGLVNYTAVYRIGFRADTKVFCCRVNKNRFTFDMVQKCAVKTIPSVNRRHICYSLYNGTKDILTLQCK